MQRRGSVSALAVTFCILLAAPVAEARQPWVVLKDCRLLRNASTDADSFHVKAGGKEYIFRLYFADAPETDESFPERVAEQAKYFRITPRQAVQLGNYAKKYTAEKLGRPFTIRTCMQDALGRSALERFYAFVETPDGDLAELLVANGLARVHGSAARPIGLSSPQREWLRLRRLEREAQQQKVGGWGAAVGRMTARLPVQPAKSGPDSFDAFFHPERIAAVADAESINSEAALDDVGAASPQPAAASAGAKLDVNSASAADLIKLPGVGAVLAQRIIEARPFKSADDLRKVKGIGAKKYEKIRPLFM